MVVEREMEIFEAGRDELEYNNKRKFSVNSLLKWNRCVRESLACVSGRDWLE